MSTPSSFMFLAGNLMKCGKGFVHVIGLYKLAELYVTWLKF